METAAKKRSTKKNFQKSILEGYKEHVLEHGCEPVSIFKFAKGLQLSEGEFYTWYTSFDSIKSAIWMEILEDTIRELESQEVYQDYSSREKFLGFLFTWIEMLKNNRSYLLSLYSSAKPGIPPVPAEMKAFRSRFKDFASGIVLEGKETQEIANRPLISDRYDEALWLQVLFVFNYWLKDQSPGFENTDAAIEKSVNLAFDLMGKSALDSFLDFAKFLYQQK